jgi:hypothetical protein
LRLSGTASFPRGGKGGILHLYSEPTYISFGL